MKIVVPVNTDDAQKQSKKLFGLVDSMYHKHGDHSIFVRFLEAVDAVFRRFEPGGEEDYMIAIRDLDSEMLDLFSQGLAVVVEHFWYNGGYADLFGPVYMEICDHWRGSSLGQFFTPWEVCKMMAKLQFEERLVEKVSRGEPLSVIDPCCGSGTMLLAARAVVAERYGRDVADRMSLNGQDVDRICCLMSKIQIRASNGRWMSNFHIATYGEIQHGIENKSKNGHSAKSGDSDHATGRLL